MTGRPLSRGAAALVALLAAGSPPSWAEDVVAADILNPLHGLAKNTLTGFRDRPLFDPARAEPPASVAAPAPVVAPPPPPEPPPGLRLVGIVSGPRTLAVIRPADGGKTRMVATGDKFGAWTVTVSADGLTLRSDARSVEIGLFRREGAADPGGAAGAGGPPPVKGADAFPPTGDPAPP